MAKRSNYKSARRRTSSRGSDKRTTNERDFVKEKESANDPAWYTVSGQLVKDAASLSFNNPSGIQYWLDQSTTGKFTTPGVLSMYMAPAPGYSEGLSSPINISAKNLYSFVRHANSGHANYDSPDLILMILAMANAYAYYGWMTRLYGMLRVYAQHNRYYGMNMLYACGVDGHDILSNMANFRAYINQFALKLSALSVPSTMSIFKRYMWMFSNVFLDEDNAKGQLYMYNPAYLYIYDEYNGAGRLVPSPLCLDAVGNANSGITYGNLVTFGDTMLGALISSEDINIMSGDILKAYGKENVWQLTLIPEEYAIVPMFSEEVLEQIHNTRFVGKSPIKDSSLAAGWDSFRVEQDPNIGQGCLICKPLVLNGGSIQGNQILDFWKADVQPEDIMVATRNMVTGRRWAQGFTAITGYGSEIPMCARLYTLTASGTMSGVYYYHTDDLTSFDTLNPTGHEAIEYVSKLTYFNEYPHMELVNYTTSAPYVERVAGSSIGEVSNFTVVDENDLEKMHLTAILSELAVPMLGNISK